MTADACIELWKRCKLCVAKRGAKRSVAVHCAVCV